jgi:hypothetical protein
VTIDPTSSSMGTMSPEPKALEPTADHGEWVEARVAA